MKNRSLLLGFLLAVVTPAVMHAQVVHDTTQRRIECAEAEGILETADPRGDLEWASAYIMACGADPWARSSAGLVRALRTSSDSTVLDLIWGNLGFLHDARIFNAAVEIAEDRGASPRARLWAALTLAKHVDPQSSYTLESLTTNDTRWNEPICSLGQAVGPSGHTLGNPFPATYRQRVKEVGSLLETESDARLKAAGACLGTAPQPWLKTRAAPPDSVRAPALP